METGFLNPIHDEEHFQSSFYSQENGLDGTENMLFGEMIIPDIIDYDNLWHSVDDMGFPSQSGESGSSKEDLQRMVFEWQNQLTYMQEPEAIKKFLPVAEKTTQEVSDILSNRACTSSPTAAPSLDDLFPLEQDKDNSSEETSENTATESIKIEAAIKFEKKEETIKFDKTEETIKFEKTEETIKLEVKEESTDEKSAQLHEEANGDIDVETVEDEVPLLMAGDLTSLLEQFEATEQVNCDQLLIVPAASPPRPSTQTIRDALPPEIINRIKASKETLKKVSIIPAIPSKRVGRAATRMQDAGVALSRNKLLKLVTGGSGGESVQLDHDYCTNGSDSASNSSRSYYVSDSSEYPSQASTPDTSYSRVPEYYTNMLPQKLRTLAADTGSRKDSGLESGENSDEDISQHVNQIKKELLVNSVSKLKSINGMTENGLVVGSAPVIRNSVPMVSVLKKNNIKVESDIKINNSSTISPSVCVVPPTQNVENTVEVSKKKKKLNLEEYRVRREERERIRSQESSRASSPIGVSCSTSAQPDSISTTQEGVSKEKPAMLSVEVQTQTCDFIDLTSSSPREHGKSRKDSKEKRNDLKHKSYRSRYASTSSSSSSVGPDRYHSHRRKRRSRSNRRHKKNSVSRMWSRSPSRSSSSRSPSSRSRSRSRDQRQKWRSRSPRRSNSRYSNNRGFRRNDSRDQSWQRSRSPIRPVRNQQFETVEKVRQIEERRVIYVGRIEEGTTKADLRSRFQQFGPIVDISVHFRERGDNYGFVTFAYKIDAYRAVEHGNDDPKLSRYDLCFGGRRAFCKQRYADLDGMATSINNQYGPPVHQPRSGESFDLLLHEVKSQLRKRSSV